MKREFVKKQHQNIGNQLNDNNQSKDFLYQKNINLKYGKASLQYEITIIPSYDATFTDKSAIRTFVSTFRIIYFLKLLLIQTFNFCFKESTLAPTQATELEISK